jgi:hypothetical protein
MNRNGLIFEQIFNHWGIIKKTVNIGADAMVGLQNRLNSIADTLMNLVA